MTKAPQGALKFDIAATRASLMIAKQRNIAAGGRVTMGDRKNKTRSRTHKSAL
jgi:hypothetical protein